MIRVFFRSRSDTALEVLALWQQVAVLKRKRPRPPLNSLDRLVWTTLRHFWPRWTDVLVIVKPETVVAWHHAGFRLYWRWLSRPIRVLIRRLAQENKDWESLNGVSLGICAEFSAVAIRASSGWRFFRITAR